MPDQAVTISIVSHRQNALVNQLLADIKRHCEARVALVLTENVGDAVPLSVENMECPVELIVNPRPKGFGANHNAAFQRCRTPFFCIANPDVRLIDDPFPALVRMLANNGVGLVGPLVRSPSGRTEDSARRFPTLGLLLRKAIGINRDLDYSVDRGPLQVDWVAGMFMVLPREVYDRLGGFDESYFLYYEDVDLCARLAKLGLRVVYCTDVAVVHAARRSSRRSLAYLRRHLGGMLRFLWRRMLNRT
jgi:N-acetylglucosaminyl-diphospho-decaprenol L-rhamnosyltransferase